MKIVTAAEMREIDCATSERYGVPSLTLMENAGAAVADFVLAEYASAERIGVVCGKGNNGGDGFVAARKLRDAGREIRIVVVADPAELRGDAAQMFKKLAVVPLIARNGEELKSGKAQSVFQADLLLDAVLGTGFRPPVSGVYAEAIAAINASEAPVIAVDIPSGADADVMGEQTGAVARADAIVTFSAPRPAHVFGLLTDGPIVVAPIGSPEEAIVSRLQLNVTTPADIAPLLAPRPPAANKGNFGHVLVVGGSVGKAGAAAMAGFSALRAGAGLSTIATPKSVLPTVAGFHPEVMTEPLEETEAGTISLRALEYGRLDSLVEHKTVLAIGPGISRNVETAEVVHTIVGHYKATMVVDADGLNAFEGCAEKLKGEGRALVITPHPGEMARLIGSTPAAVQRDRLNIARSFAREHDIIVVLKGHRTLIVHPDGTVWVNTTGNPGMATGGTGDILTGMVAGLVAQNPERVFEAVVAAVYLHGLAGDIAREVMGEQSLVATDLVKLLPQAFHRVRRAASEKTLRIGP
jgi:ADP-dependent NAD(P)H-hydrate dehydratase / NAD(P)H-hydrate epimerase